MDLWPVDIMGIFIISDAGFKGYITEIIETTRIPYHFKHSKGKSGLQQDTDRP